MGQVRPGDQIKFRRLTLPEAHAALLAADAHVAAVRAAALANAEGAAALPKLFAEAKDKALAAAAEVSRSWSPPLSVIEHLTGTPIGAFLRQQPVMCNARELHGWVPTVRWALAAAVARALLAGGADDARDQAAAGQPRGG